MDMYTIICYGLVILLFAWRISRGFKKGLVAELNTTVSIVIALALGFALKRVINDFTAAKYGSMITFVAIIVVILIIYKVVSIIFAALKLFSNLPIIHGIDKILGVLIGIFEALIIIILLINLIKEYLLV